jgi:hypothetical protein
MIVGGDALFYHTYPIAFTCSSPSSLQDGKTLSLQQPWKVYSNV